VQGKGSYAPSSKVLLPLTICQLYGLIPNATNDAFVLPENSFENKQIEVNYARVIGRIVEIIDDVTKTSITLNDGTGQIQLSFYHDEDSVHWSQIRPLLR
jgi:hypothetical protein